MSTPPAAAMPITERNGMPTMTRPSSATITVAPANTTASRFGTSLAPIADLDGDGRDEFIIAQADGTITVCDRNGRALSGWPFKTGHAIYHAPRIIDIDGDGRPDLVFTAWNPEGVGVRAGYIMALSRNGTPLAGYPKYIGKTVAPLTFADLNNNGYLEMIAAGGINYTGKQLHVFKTRARNHIKIAVLGQEVFFQ